LEKIPTENEDKDQFKKKILDKALEIRKYYDKPDVLLPLLDDWDKEYGFKYNSIVEEVLGEHIRQTWSEKAKTRGSNTVEDLVALLWDWPEAEFDIERKDRGIRVFCSKCPIADTYRSLGKKQHGKLFHCMYNNHLCTGFNSKIKYEKKKGLMSGADCCELYYTI
jgi:hypothetical protein